MSFSENPYGSSPLVSPEDGRFVNRRRVISSDSEGMEVCLRLVQDSKKIVSDAALVQRRLNNAPPYNTAQLREDQKGWKSNVSASLIPITINRIVPRLSMRLESSKTLTMSSLPRGIPRYIEKTDLYRSVTTSYFRNWNGRIKSSSDFIRALARETVAFGYCAAAFFDPFDWKPSVLRKDQIFFPIGTRQDEEPALVLIKKDYYPHELLELIGDPDLANEVGWNIENCVESINSASASVQTGAPYQARQIEELYRQSAAALSYLRTSNSIETFHLFTKEASGAVSHYIYDSKLQKSLFRREDRFPSVASIVTVFCFELGDMTIHGSLGVGQMVYDMAVQAERAFNDMNDSLRLRSKMFITVPEASSLSRMKRMYFDDALIVSGVESVPTSPLPSVVEEYERAFDYYKNIVDAIVGTYIPLSPQDQPRTAALANYLALREQELDQASLQNFLLSWGQFMTQWQIRMAQPDPASPFIQKYQRELLEGGLSMEEIQMIAQSPAISSIVDISDAGIQAKAAFYEQAKNSPFFDQRRVALAQARLVLTEEEVNDLKSMESDPSNDAAQERQAKLENLALRTGQTIPVDLRNDNNLRHLDFHETELDSALNSASIESAAALLNHYAAHVEGAIANKELVGDLVNELKARYAERVKLYEALQRGLNPQAAQNQIAGQPLVQQP